MASSSKPSGASAGGGPGAAVSKAQHPQETAGVIEMAQHVEREASAQHFTEMRGLHGERLTNRQMRDAIGKMAAYLESRGIHVVQLKEFGPSIADKGGMEYRQNKDGTYTLRLNASLDKHQLLGIMSREAGFHANGGGTRGNAQMILAHATGHVVLRNLGVDATGFTQRAIHGYARRAYPATDRSGRRITNEQTRHRASALIQKNTGAIAKNAIGVSHRVGGRVSIANPFGPTVGRPKGAVDRRPRLPRSPQAAKKPQTRQAASVSSRGPGRPQGSKDRAPRKRRPGDATLGERKEARNAKRRTGNPIGRPKGSGDTVKRRRAGAWHKARGISFHNGKPTKP